MTSELNNVVNRFHDEQSYEVDTQDRDLELHCAAHVDGEHKHPLGATVTEGDTHESPQCDHLKDDIEVCKYLDSIIWAVTVDTRTTPGSGR